MNSITLKIRLFEYKERNTEHYLFCSIKIIFDKIMYDLSYKSYKHYIYPDRFINPIEEISRTNEIFKYYLSQLPYYSY
jgi:hypothetical protein